MFFRIITGVILLLAVQHSLFAQHSDSLVVIRCKDYYAEIYPAFGGNCIRLRHLPSDIEVLRTPVSKESFEATPLLYGMPVLFFPNRIRGGRFVFEGRTYHWPLNEPERNGYVHGDLYTTRFKVVRKGRSDVELEFVATEKQPYMLFPHSFVLRLRYRVDAGGLHQQVVVRNTSNENMPFGLAFHTTFNTPLGPKGETGDMRLILPVNKEFPRDTATLTPNGEVLSDYPQRDALRAGTLKPAEHVLSRFFSRSKSGAMRLTDSKSGWAVTYLADASYKFWMLWNGGRTDLLVVEPQTCMIDPFNIDMPTLDKGIIIIKPGFSFKTQATISVKR